MGAWGSLAFDNDTANDWAYGLEGVDDLALVEEALAELEEVGGDYLDQDVACVALAACEVLARLQGHAGYTNGYTRKVDEWVAAHPIRPQRVLLDRAVRALDRVLDANSELSELWDGDPAWKRSVEELRRRLG